MLVKDIMKEDVITLTSSATVLHALQLMKEHNIRHIPVINNERHVIGIVSDRDIRDASPSILEPSFEKELLKKPISAIMTYPVVTIHPYEFFEEVASIFYQKEFACLPVVQNKQLTGMITEKDFLYAFIQLTGTHAPSTQLEIKVPDRIGVLSDVCQFFTIRQIKIVSVYSFPDPKQQNYKVLVFRIQTMNPIMVVRDFESSEYEVLYPYWEDQHEH
ncbi:CBS and ACT domain-containing protein [Gracilibacillus caseinilyticus]|uniref:CBS and ACT domain-containing protein n=1 Tax=Gracilibacillus caseinilyticus TaxID=2932256 RepID=A0ABY4ERQ8_9BACI|nr:CBS and ACT domain-containing protein [Gracilibacillus caseinilyticus]UOQ47121.1 CBS and ACT domain-containing protein [Gracilibacillus caseinilyticus]